MMNNFNLGNLTKTQSGRLENPRRVCNDRCPRGLYSLQAQAATRRQATAPAHHIGTRFPLSASSSYPSPCPGTFPSSQRACAAPSPCPLASRPRGRPCRRGKAARSRDRSLLGGGQWWQTACASNTEHGARPSRPGRLSAQAAGKRSSTSTGSAYQGCGGENPVRIQASFHQCFDWASAPSTSATTDVDLPPFRRPRRGFAKSPGRRWPDHQPSKKFGPGM